MRGDWATGWGLRTHKLTPSTRLRRAWGYTMQLFCCFLVGRNGSREQIDDVSHANEAPDPKKQ